MLKPTLVAWAQGLTPGRTTLGREVSAVPRYKFSWTNLPPALLKGLARHVGLGGPDPAEALRGAHGARPNEDFVHETREPLRDQWLAHDPDTLAAVVEGLWRPSSRDGYLLPPTARAQLGRLGQPRNTAPFRQVVLGEFIGAGQRSISTPPGPERPQAEVQRPVAIRGVARTPVGMVAPLQAIQSDRNVEGRGGPRTPDVGQDDDGLMGLLINLPGDETPVGNSRVAQELGLSQPAYKALTDSAKSAGLVRPGRGRGGSLAITDRGRGWLSERGTSTEVKEIGALEPGNETGTTPTNGQTVTRQVPLTGPIRGSGWQTSQPGDREVRRQFRLVLRNNGLLPPQGAVFDRAYAYIAEHY